jgi:glycosyltransferase involved in cell wall biosynthesis
MKSQISILFPCYQINDWLSEALTSVNQAVSKVESELLIVANNMQNEQLKELGEICSQLLSANYRIIDAGNTNLVGALNYGLENCQFDLIARMDQDDLMNVERLHLQRDFLDSHPDHVLVGGSVLVIDEDGEPKFTQSYPIDANDVSLKLRTSNCFAHPAVMYRKSAVIKAGGYSQIFSHAEDYDLFVRLNRIGRCANLPQVVLKYRISPNQVSKKFRSEQIISTKSIIILQAILISHLEESFLPPSEFSQLKSWNRNVIQKSIVSFLSIKGTERAKGLVLRKAVAASFVAIARSSRIQKNQQKTQISINLLFAWFFSPGIVIKFIGGYIRSGHILRKPH